MFLSEAGDQPQVLWVLGGTVVRQGWGVGVGGGGATGVMGSRTRLVHDYTLPDQVLFAYTCEWGVENCIESAQLLV